MKRVWFRMVQRQVMAVIRARGRSRSSATDGIMNIVIDPEGAGAGGAPVTFTLAQAQAFNGTQTVDMGEGILTLNSYVGDGFAGTVNYSYTLKDNIDNDSLVPVGTDDVTLAAF